MGHKNRSESHVHTYKHGRETERATTPSTRSDRSQQPPITPADALFTIDRQGDDQNLRFGSIDRYKIPKYRTTGYGRLLGLDSRFKIVARTETKREVNDEALDSSSRPAKLPSLLQRQDSRPSSPLTREQPSVHDCFAVQHDYVKLGNKRQKLPREGSSVRELIRHGQPGEKQSGSESSSESDAESHDGTHGNKQQLDDTNPFAAFKSHPDNQKYVELRRQTEHDPGNVTAWLDLIDHQERHFTLSAGPKNHRLSAGQRRTVTDMKVSLYEKALTIVKDTPGREKLVVGLMKEGAKVWDTNKQAREWTSFLTDNAPLRLWYDYLNFCQTNVVAFSYEKCIDVYLTIFRKVIKLEGIDHDHNCSYIILRLTTFMLDAGFSERSIAIWQVLLEYNLFTISVDTANFQALQQFWESEIPRIGEQGAKGWQVPANDDIPPRSDRPLPRPSQSALFSEWGSAEMSRSAEDIMPARTLDDTVEDDPFRVILYSDVEDFVFRIKSAQGKVFLKQAFAKFCSFTPLQKGIVQCRGWWADPFLCQFTPSSKFDQLADTSTLFEPPESCLRLWDERAIENNPVSAFGTLALTQIAEFYVDDTQLAEYVIALRLVQQPSSARKFAKTLLKRRPNALLLYNAFALVEVYSDQLESAFNVWSTALSMASSFDISVQPQRFTLWRSWIWALLRDQNYGQALALLIDVVPSDSVTSDALKGATLNASTTFTSVQRLHAEAYFREQISNALDPNSNLNIETIPELTDLYAMFKYLFHDQDLSEAVAVYQSTLAYLTVHTNRHLELLVVEERVHLLLCRALDFHAQTSNAGYRPTTLLSIFEKSLSKFPHNSVFVGLREKYLQRAGLIDRLRVRSNHPQDVNEGQNRAIDGLDLIQDLQQEMARNEVQGRTVHSLRRTFERAVTMEESSKNLWGSCPGIWREYMWFEASNASHDDNRTSGSGNGGVKAVWLTGLRACPWHKELYLQGFTMKGHVLGSEGELERIYRSMGERGLRVRVDLEEILQDRGNESES